MTTSTHLVRTRRFLPLFVTQLLGAFNDNLFKNAMVLFVVYSVYNSEAEEAKFSAIASGLFIIPFFVLSALAGPAGRHARQGADHPHRQVLRDPDHAGRRRRAAAGLAGHRGHRSRHPADAARAVRHGGAFDLLRPDQIRDPAPAPAQGGSAGRHRPGRGGDLYRHSRRHDPGRLDRRGMGGARRRADRAGRLSHRAAGSPRPADERDASRWTST